MDFNLHGMRQPDEANCSDPAQSGLSADSLVESCLIRSKRFERHMARAKSESWPA